MKRRLVIAAVVCALSGAPAAAEEPSGPAPLVALREGLLKGIVKTAADAGAAYTGVGAGWKLIDLTTKFTEKALDRDAEAEAGQLVTLKAYDAELKALTSQGVDLDHDARAKALRAEVRALGQEMNADDLDPVEFIDRAVQRHYRYALAYVAADEAFAKVLEYGGRKLLGGLRTIPAVGNLVSRFEENAPHWVDGRKWIKGKRQYVVWDALKLGGWTTLKARADLARKLPDEYLAKMMADAADAYYEAQVKDAKDRVLGSVYDHLKESLPRSSWSGSVRLAVARAPMAAPAPPVAVAAPPMAAAALPLAIAARPEPAIVPADPMMRTIIREDTRGERWSQPRQSAPVEERPAPVQSAPDPRQEARAAYWHHELMCAGAGRKAGCGNESWDGNRNGLGQ